MCHIQVANKEEIAQCIMCHFLINKRKVVLDQLRDGLRTLGLLEEMKKNPPLFESLFIHREDNLTPAIVKDILTFTDSEHKDVKEMVLQFIDESDHEGRVNFVLFTIPVCV